ncbi:RNA-binding protein [Maricaulis sp.]|uniref:RNA-binding protein n=1 Tax=Maricaulis sp. TaxID=1486257 RepID=UPI003A91692D
MRRNRRLTNPKAATQAIREKRCIASGAVRDEAELIRLVVGPGDEVFPDIAAKLPGRGIWISADRASVELAARKGLFNRSAGRAVKVPGGLADMIEAQLAARALSLLGLARRAGEVALGFDAARIALKAGRPAWRIEAVDGAEDGRVKLDRLTEAAWGDVPVAGGFTAEQLGEALGRGTVVHGVLTGGSQVRAFGVTIGKLDGFRPPAS